MDPIQLGKFLSQLRNDKNLTQEELAEKLFIDKKKVSRWECGTSIPDFDLLIKISKILDVSLYELSICKRIEKEKINTRIINKYKSIKDYKKYVLKNKIIVIIKVIFILISLVSIIYTIKNCGNVIVYELKSDSDEYNISGDVIKYPKHVIFNVTSITNKNGEISTTQGDCLYEIYTNKKRVIQWYDVNKNKITTSVIYIKDNEELELNSNNSFILTLKCNNNQKEEIKKDYTFHLEKKYSNSIF